MSKNTTPRPHAEVQALLDIGDAVDRAAEQISQRLAVSATDANRAIREFMDAWREKP